MKLRSLLIIGGLFSSAPQNYLDNILQNKLGHQFVRYFFYNIIYAARPKPKASSRLENLEALKNDGIVVWEDFFTPEEWSIIKSEFEVAKPGIELKPYYSKKNPGIKMANIEVSEKSETFKLISSNITLNDCAGYIVHREIKKYLPAISYMVVERDANMEFDDDIENILHSDTFYPTAKAFVYLSEVNNENAPYVYAIGSHKFSFRRALHEYNMSVRVAKLAKGKIGSIPPEALTNRADRLRNVVTDSQKRALGIVETYFPGKENTMIMSNNRGFHRRGEFTKGARREIILISYRYASTSLLRRVVNRLFPTKP